ncbi:MAG: hypothetical protein AB8B51_10405 [Sedimentitalea sp.]
MKCSVFGGCWNLGASNLHFYTVQAVSGVLNAVAASFLILSIDPALRPSLISGAIKLVVVVIAMTLITAPWGAKLTHMTDPKPNVAAFLTRLARNMLRRALRW